MSRVHVKKNVCKSSIIDVTLDFGLLSNCVHCNARKKSGKNLPVFPGSDIQVRAPVPANGHGISFILDLGIISACSLSVSVAVVIWPTGTFVSGCWLDSSVVDVPIVET